MWSSREWLVPSVLAVFALLAVVSCSDITFEGGGPVTIDLSADRTSVTVGDSVTFAFNATGTFLNGIVIDYGDGVADSVATQGAQTAVGVVSHAFGGAGSYTVVGRAEDGATGVATAELVIAVGGSAAHTALSFDRKGPEFGPLQVFPGRSVTAVRRDLPPTSVAILQKGRKSP